jgi:cobalt/nickel transport system permease protein
MATLEVPRVAAAGAALALGLLLMARLPWRLVLVRLMAAQAILLPCLVILPFTFAGERISFGPWTLSREGLQVAALLYLRALALVTIGLAVVYSTPMVVLLHALQTFRLPRVLVETALLTYRYAFTLVWELTRVRWALATRGFRGRVNLHSQRTLAHVIGVSLIRSLERTERIYQSMLCRGYRGRLHTRRQFQSSLSDWLMALGCLGCGAALLALDVVYADRSGKP